MKSDLLFYVVSARKWSDITRGGEFKPEELVENNKITLIEAEKVNDYLNSKFSGRKNLFLLIIDITRMDKRLKKNDEGLYIVEGAVPVVAILDKIRLDSNKEGKFDIQIDQN
ncbi:hypothetical protein [Rhodohalobacter sp.]|uniref:hypothetical protein n=1 Tax=Rhodohalobacter sp. TaxID=1974210 RepID=UPI003565EA48